MNSLERVKRKVDALDSEVRRLVFKWRFFKQVFGNPVKVELLNAAAPAFFRCVEDSMLYDILLSMSRLIDPPKSAGCVPSICLDSNESNSVFFRSKAQHQSLKRKYFS